MLRIMLCGCNGKMGQVITGIASEMPNMEIVAGVDPFGGMKNSYPVYNSATDVSEKVDVIIDFSNPAALENLLLYAEKTGTPIVISTTGHTPDQRNTIFEYSKKVPVFFSGNMSLGINLMLELVKKAAESLNGLFDIEILEKHHNKKIDAPSGTALMIAEAANSVHKDKYLYKYDRHSDVKQREVKEIGIHSVRGGNIVGEHTVIFAGMDEIVEITHKAMSKEIFAIGAIKAAVYMKNQPAGKTYSMSDIFQDS